MKRLILFSIFSLAFVSLASGTSYDTGVEIEKVAFDGCDQELNVTDFVNYNKNLMVHSYGLHTLISFNFDLPCNCYGVKYLKGIDHVPIALNRKARDNC